jgi:Asp-tRNA(Asn)/Glu-tRNA(Gln) amidotransferase A subunit family amidase
LLKNKKITSTELTKLYLKRLKRFGDTLQCIITILEETALQQAKKADEEIAVGKYKGPLHGIPYGIKDLLSVKGTKTTWGATPFKDQTIDGTATVAKKLEEAGAVLVVKLTMGALAMGDIWYNGVTKNPWNLEQGSSGSSAGSASATSAGLVAFAIGTETWGSIVSPSTRCGITGLRPTYGMVSRHGAMALSWSMDKIGPMARSALDCAIIYSNIKGNDGMDPSVTDAAFNYDSKTGIKNLRIGYLKDLFDSDTIHKANNQKVLDVITGMGVKLEPVTLPSEIPVNSLSIILSAEAAAAFDNLTRSKKDSLLANQKKGAWPNIFRGSRFIPAVEYVNATRIRQQLIEAYHQRTKDFDVIITPSFEGDQLLMTNLTGHPCLVVPNGFNEKGSPTSISFLGKLQGEAALITIGRAYQEATEWEEKQPPIFTP